MRQTHLGEFIKKLQSTDIGFRKGEITVVTASGERAPVILDSVSTVFMEQSFESRPYWMEFIDYTTGDLKTYWIHYPRLPFPANMHRANRVISKDSEGNFYWYKHRSGPTGKLTEKEMKELILILLKSEPHRI